MIKDLIKNATKGITCSKLCRSKLYGRRVETQCANCFKHIISYVTKDNTSGRHYCSMSCSAKVNNKGRQRNKPKKRTCKLCNDAFYNNEEHVRLKHCEDCLPKIKDAVERNKLITKTECTEALSLKGKHPSWLSNRIRAFGRSWNSDLLKMPCQKCGYQIHIEICHIKAISKFGNNDTLGEINHPDNIIVLCSNHHWELDNGKLLLKDIPLREGQENRVVSQAK